MSSVYAYILNYLDLCCLYWSVLTSGTFACSSAVVLSLLAIFVRKHCMLPAVHLVEPHGAPPGNNIDKTYCINNIMITLTMGVTGTAATNTCYDMPTL